ncbi:hypothetical protein AB1Y20_012039 [Prymnesium parvum]|uniref:E2 ubiquitin-conjugating enzyme n=1 Tax=Prymnesium parvum TaxID=97485 RepID=A0AB34IPS5_PRYPA|mmetsp:Transcript_37761/g.93855  ORF Transcript_37761/g.93855 Transcript_37761/m.93855 type:complete len:210 (-) Transcript_37761:66-695(-)
MASKACLMRLQKEHQRLALEPVPNIEAEPRPNNILEWHFVIKGPAASPYEGGQYHGKLVFPPEYPYKPPSIIMLTPNGRFNTNTRLCLSMSDFHPETWVPAWSVASILNGVMSFMLESTPTVGSIETSLAERKRLARASHAWNRKGAIFCELFPHLVAEELPDDADAEVVDPAQEPRSEGGGGKLFGALYVSCAVVVCAVAGYAVFQDL